MITLIATVLFCLGWRMVTDEHQIFYFIRKYFYHKAHEQKGGENKYWIFIGKPLVLCITCLASFWGTIVFVCINGISVELIPTLIFNCISASFIQTFIWTLYGKLNN